MYCTHCVHVPSEVLNVFIENRGLPCLARFLPRFAILREKSSNLGKSLCLEMCFSPLGCICAQGTSRARIPPWAPSLPLCLPLGAIPTSMPAPGPPSLPLCLPVGPNPYIYAYPSAPSLPLCLPLGPLPTSMPTPRPPSLPLCLPPGPVPYLHAHP